MVETVVSSALPVDELLSIRKNQIRAGSSKRQRKKNLYRYGHTWR